ncbi:hypothetical protein Hanom_Chr09g00834071 [Helianthus anomalus]
MMVVIGVQVSRKGWMVVVSNEDDVGGADDTQNRTRNSLRHLKPGNQRLCLLLNQSAFQLNPPDLIW